MNKLIQYFFLIVILGCNEKPVSWILSFPDNGVQMAELKLNRNDTIAVTLNEQQINGIKTAVNFKGKLEPLKAKPKYWLAIKIKHDSILWYKIIDGYFGRYDIFTKLNQKDFFENIYLTQDKVRSQIKTK